MNLYVFLVDTGTTYDFDINLSLSDVKTLKKAITAKSGIPEDKQSLLISGGETLHQDARICSYRAAGTETNPIFLFNRESIENDTPPTPTVDYGQDVNMKDRIDSCLGMEPSYNTVVSRAELAQQLNEIACQQLSICERLVQDQHLQHQGWAAVIANLEDKGKELITEAGLLKEEYEKLCGEKESHFKAIDNVDNDLEILKQIPLLPSITSPILIAQFEKPNLLDWVGSQGAHMELKKLAEGCSNFLRNSLDNAMANLEERTRVVAVEINKREMKEIGGLQKRLQGLDNLISNAKKIVAELDDLAKAFHQNQQRASNLRDPSIFPDLCKSHQTQLTLMSDKYQELRTIREKCSTAKKEFCGVVHRRLQWVIYVSKQNADVCRAQKMMLVQFNKIRKYIEAFHQLHQAPEIYFSFISEVLRRRQVSKHFLEWGSDMAKSSSTFLDGEKLQRKSFHDKVASHFLRRVFRGMEDEPPDFARYPPPQFDNDLPQITQEEVDSLKELFPQYAEFLSVPSYVPNFPPRFSSPIEEINVNSPKRNESENEDFETVNSALLMTEAKLDSTTPKIESNQELGTVQEEVQAKDDDNQPTTSTDQKEESDNTEPKELEDAEPEEPETICVSAGTNTDPQQLQDVGCDPIISHSQNQDAETLTDHIQKMDVMVEAMMNVSCGGDQIQVSPPPPEPVASVATASKLTSEPQADMEITSSTAIVKKTDQPEKISVLNCEIGDLVLITYHEKYKSFIVFSLNPTLHFIKTACLTELKLNTEPERRDWALAIVTKKYYCQAAKAQNRYHVPINTKFFCVEAKLWDKANLYCHPAPMACSTIERGSSNTLERLSQSQSPLISSVSILPSSSSPPE
ncbi:autophagy-related 17 [Brevipalpus obovatus]|uniref:autophagy-related 17 n=1 Tax=Brevipalpus obovatus TaxID=246614 RepID=UPI003D9E9BAD